VAKFVATDYNITINGTPFSSSLAAVTLDISVGAGHDRIRCCGDTAPASVA
jgi:hypothetical protein